MRNYDIPNDAVYIIPDDGLITNMSAMFKMGGVDMDIVKYGIAQKYANLCVISHDNPDSYITVPHYMIKWNKINNAWTRFGLIKLITSKPCIIIVREYIYMLTYGGLVTRIFNNSTHSNNNYDQICNIIRSQPKQIYDDSNDINKIYEIKI